MTTTVTTPFQSTDKRDYTQTHTSLKDEHAHTLKRSKHTHTHTFRLVNEVLLILPSSKYKHTRLLHCLCRN